MKTAVSLPDEVFAEADALAKAMAVSRSELYVLALRDYLAAHARSRVTEAIDVYIADQGQPVDAALNRSTLSDMRRVEW